MTVSLTKQQLLDAVKMTADSDTLLQYAVLTNPNPLTVGASGTTLTLLVSNPNDVAVICKKIVVTIPVGTNAQDLIASSDIGSEVPAGWEISGAFVLTPKPGEETITKHGLPFVFTKIKVNAEPGTCGIEIKETAKTSSDVEKIRKATIPVAKFPPQFAVSDLSVTPSSVPSGGTAQVMWTGSPANYVLGYNDGSGYAEHNVGNSGPYAATNLKRSPAVFFTLTVTLATHGQILTLWRRAFVEVEGAKPSITSFSGAIVGARLVKFTFSSKNASSCEITGFAQSFNPAGTTDALNLDHLRYTIIAHNAATGLSSDPVSILVKWGVAASAQIAPRAHPRHSRLFITPDGANLIVVTNQTVDRQDVHGNGVYIVDASTLAARTILSETGDTPAAPALSQDGQWLLLGFRDSDGPRLGIYGAPKFERVSSIDAAVVGGEYSYSAFSPVTREIYIMGRGKTLYVKNAPGLTSYFDKDIDIWGGVPAMSASGGLIFIAGNGSRQVVVMVAAVAEVRARIGVPQVNPFGVLFDAQRDRLFVPDFVLERSTIEVVDTKSYKHIGTVRVGGGPAQLTLSPTREEIYVARWGANSIAVLDAATLEVVGENPIGEGTIDLAFSPNGQRLYVLTVSGKVLAMKMTEVS